MDRLQAAIAGFQTIDADPAYKEQAAKNLDALADGAGVRSLPAADRMAHR